MQTCRRFDPPLSEFAPMSRPSPAIALDLPNGSQSLHRRIHAELSGAIRRGELKPGDRLPSSRDLAKRLGVSRNTVVAAIEDLAADGLVEGRIGSGTYVADMNSYCMAY